jgi:hypothetical protein
MEESLLKWVRETVGDLGVTPTDFKYGFRDGLAFAALVSKYDPTLLDFNRVNKDDPAALLAQAFELAETHMNIPQLLSPTDLTEGDPDERSVQLYVSLFFHAFSSKREKEEMELANQGIASRLQVLGTRLQREAQEREELLKQKDSLLAAQAGLDSTIGEKGKQAVELNEATSKLQSEVQALRARLEELHQLKTNPCVSHVDIVHNPGHTKKNFIKDLHHVLGTHKAYQGYAECIGHWFMWAVKESQKVVCKQGIMDCEQ